MVKVEVVVLVVVVLVVVVLVVVVLVGVVLEVLFKMGTNKYGIEAQLMHKPGKLPFVGACHNVLSQNDGCF